MNISRRAFLGGAIILAAATAVPVEAFSALAPRPRIVGDGVHDDTAGLQALFDGEPVLIEGRVVTARDGMISLRGSIHKISRPLALDRPSIEIDELRLVRSEHFTGSCILSVERVGEVRIGLLEIGGGFAVGAHYKMEGSVDYGVIEYPIVA
jgi:hypothetical protein